MTSKNANILFEVVCEKWDDDREDFITEPFPVLFGTREEAEAMKAKLLGGSDLSFCPADAVDIEIHEMAVRGNAVERVHGFNG